jgi:hypothetical protein
LNLRPIFQNYHQNKTLTGFYPNNVAIGKITMLIIENVMDTPIVKYAHVGLMRIFLRTIKMNMPRETKDAPRAIKAIMSFVSCVLFFSIISLSLAPNDSNNPRIIPKHNNMNLIGSTMYRETIRISYLFNMNP